MMFCFLPHSRVARSTLDWWYRHDLIPIVALVGVATMYAALELPSLGRRSDGLPGFIAWFLTPVVVVYVLFSIHRYWAWRFGDDEPAFGAELLLSTAGMVLPWVVGGAFTRRWWRPWTWIAAAAAGATAHFARWGTHRFLDAFAQHDPQAFCVLDLTATLLLLFLQITLFIGLASRDMTDEDREWWARAAAWILIVAVTWLVTSGVVILGPLLLQTIIDAVGLSYQNGRAGLGSSRSCHRRRRHIGRAGRQRLACGGFERCSQSPLRHRDVDRGAGVGCQSILLQDPRPRPVQQAPRSARRCPDLLRWGAARRRPRARRIVSINEFSLRHAATASCGRFWVSRSGSGGTEPVYRLRRG